MVKLVSVLLMLPFGALCACASQRDPDVALAPVSVDLPPPDVTLDLPAETSQWAPLAQPLLMFESIWVPTGVTVSALAGATMRLTRHGWVPVRPGDALQDGDLLQIDEQATLEMRNGGEVVARFSAAPRVRRLQLRVSERHTAHPRR